MERENHGAIIDYVGGRLQEVVQHGFPEVGWEGDPLLRVGFDRQQQRWVVMDIAFNPPHRALAYQYDGLRSLDYRDICRRLKAAQVPRGDGGTVTIADRMMAWNRAKEEDADRRMREGHIEVARELYDTSKHRKTFV